MSHSPFHPDHLAQTVRAFLVASPWFRWLNGISAVFLLLTAVLPVWRLIPSGGDPQFIPLHYNVTLGIDQFGPWYAAFILPGWGLAFFLINGWWQMRVWQQDRPLALVFSVSNVLLQMGLFVGTALLILLNL